MAGFPGGRRDYEENHGNMDVKQTHANVPISLRDAQDWLFCIDKALEANQLAGQEVARLRTALRRVALVLANDLLAWGEPQTSVKNQGSSST